MQLPTITKGIAHLQEKLDDWADDIDYANDSKVKIYGRAALSGIGQGLLDWPVIWGTTLTVAVGSILIQDKLGKH